MYKELEEHIEFLLSVALRKCGDPYDAEDLTQDTLLAALYQLAKGKPIRDLRGWLLTVLNNKWNDRLRKKYRQPLVSIGEGFDVASEDEELLRIGETDQGEQVRKAVAFLGKLHRETVVRHYMYGESIAEIAAALNVPEGTVKRRLHDGREELKKGITRMENFTEQSYRPITLQLSHSGNWGRNKEPVSLIQNDLLAQNILWAAYEKPVTAEEIALALGTPAAYVEPILEKLTDGELMKRKGNKYYTDFLITTPEQQEKHIPAQIDFVKEHFESLWSPIRKGLIKLREQDFYKNCNFDQQNSLEMYFAFNCLDFGLYGIQCDLFGGPQEFPPRGDGGCWIAFARVDVKLFDPREHIPLMAHTYSGERGAYYENYAGRRLYQHLYGADGFPDYPYNRSSDYTFLRNSDDVDEIILQLMFILYTGTAPESVGFNTEYLKMIPHLTKCKLLRTENGKPAVNVPVLTETEFRILCGLLQEVREALWTDDPFRKTLWKFMGDKKVDVPAHLDSVPLHKQYFYATNAMLFATVREAMARGELYDGHYDDDSGDTVNQHPCPMVLVME